MSITQNKFFTNKGGNVFASGGFGCVFRPALKCKGFDKREKNKVSKLMLTKYAIDEYKEINEIKIILQKIPNYKDYFLVDDITLCKPEKLTLEDLKHLKKKCNTLKKYNFKSAEINNRIEELMALNIPNGGVTIDDYITENFAYNKLFTLNSKLHNLLKFGIMPMNEKHIFHCDIKDSNVLIDNNFQTRLIDWGLSLNYDPNKEDSIPRKMRVRPLQFNLPFSTIIFSETFLIKYKQYFESGGSLDENSIKMFVTNYVNFIVKDKKKGHYKSINRILATLFKTPQSDDLENVNNIKAETEMTNLYIINYISSILLHFTKFRENGTIDFTEYFNEVFIKIVDVFGFLTIYFSLLDIFTHFYSNLTKQELEILNLLKYILIKYLYSPRITPIDMNELYESIDKLGHLMQNVTKNKHINLYNSSIPSETKIKIKKGGKNNTKNTKNNKNRSKNNNKNRSKNNNKNRSKKII